MSSPELAGTVASRRNPLIRRIARLERDPEARHREGVYLIWGRKFVEEAMEEPGRVERLLVGARALRQPAARPLLRLARQASIALTAVEEVLLEELLPGFEDQGFAALVVSKLMTPDEMVSGRPDPILLVADRIQDPGNLGTLIRVGEAAGISGLLVVPGTVDPYHSRSARASAGSILRVPVARLPEAGPFTLWCRERGFRILAAIPAEGIPCHRFDLRGKIALVLGNEGDGVSQEWIQAANARLTVPLTSPVQSLNVALAAAILLYEAARQRRG